MGSQVQVSEMARMQILIISSLMVLMASGLPQIPAFPNAAHPNAAHTSFQDPTLAAHPNAAHTSLQDPTLAAHPNAAHTSTSPTEHQVVGDKKVDNCDTKI